MSISSCFSNLPIFILFFKVPKELEEYKEKREKKVHVEAMDQMDQEVHSHYICAKSIFESLPHLLSERSQIFCLYSTFLSILIRAGVK